MMLKELTPLEAQIAWQEAEAYILRAADGDDPEVFVRSLQARVFAGLNTLWRLEEEGKLQGYAVTVVYTSDGVERVAQIYLASGESLEAFLAQTDAFLAWAIRHKIDHIEIQGRKGWEKILRPYGFTHNYTSLVRRVDERLN